MATLRWIDLSDRGDDDLFQAWADVHAASDRHILGDAATPWTARELRAMATDNPHRQSRFVGALEGSVLVGAGRLDVFLADNPALAMLHVHVLPSHRRRGLGTVLLEQLERRAADLGRTSLLAQTQWPASGEDVDGGFARRHGYADAQTVRRSVLSLPLEVAGLEALRDGAGRADAGAYELATAWDELPAEWLTDRAELARRMSTDIPLGDMPMEEEVWDESRVADAVARLVTSGRRYVETVARHVGSGRLVGYTAFSVSADTPHLAYQGDTLVMREHRGHGLGARLKAANTLALMEVLPEVEMVRTWNAQENAPMLAVNVAMGFEADAYEREWTRSLG